MTKKIKNRKTLKLYQEEQRNGRDIRIKERIMLNQKVDKDIDPIIMKSNEIVIERFFRKKW